MKKKLVKQPKYPAVCPDCNSSVILVRTVTFSNSLSWDDEDTNPYDIEWEDTGNLEDSYLELVCNDECGWDKAV